MSDIDPAKVSAFMQKRLNTKAAAGLDLTFQFHITDAGNYYLTVKDGTCELLSGDAPNAAVTLTMDKETLKGVLVGQISGMKAFMSGRIQAQGKIMLAMKLGDLFPS